MLLTHMLDTLTKEGFKHIYIDCGEWNVPSIHGIQRAGFRFIGYGQIKRNGQFATKNPDDIRKDKLYIVT